MPQLPFRKASSYHDVPPISWLARPWIAKASVTELIGTQKDAGKTTLIMRGIVSAVLSGGTFLGQRCVQGPVLYLTEMPPSIVRKDLELADIIDQPGLHILQWHDVSGTDWKMLTNKLRADAQEMGAVLIVIDTLSHFALGEDESENDASVAIKVIKPLQKIAHSDGVSVLIVRHEPKGAGSKGPAKAGRGAGAFSAAVDIILRLRRKGGSARPGIRVIESRGRLSHETPEETTIELLPSGYILIGQKKSDDPVRDVILKALVDGALSLPDLVDMTKQKKTIIQSALELMKDEGLISQNGSAAIPRFHLKKEAKADPAPVDNA